MKNKRFKWLLSFGEHPIDNLVVWEDHPEIDYLKSKMSLIGATLIDCDKFSLLDPEESSLSIVEFIVMEPCQYQRTFTRVEMDVLTGQQRSFPVIVTKSHDVDRFFFVLENGFVETTDSRYSPTV